MTAARPFSVMAKPVGSRCNLRCPACYYIHKPASVARMSDDTLERFVTQFIAASPGPEVSFVWHGGEPTLAGLDFYRRVVELQGRYLPDGWQCWNNLQTNGVLLDDAWCDFLAEWHFDVGISVDGPAWLHDEQRPDARGHGSHAAAVAAIKRLQARRLQPDLLCTVTSATAHHAAEVYRSLRDLGTGWMQFIPIHNPTEFSPPRPQAAPPTTPRGPRNPGNPSTEEYNDFLIAVFDEWVRHDVRRVEVQLFAETARTLAGGAPGLCWLAPTCGRALVIEAAGGVYSCDHFVTPEHRLGDIARTPLAELADAPQQDAFGRAKAHLASECRACPWLALCHGGCPKDRGALTGINALCPAQFFAHAVPVLARMVSDRAPNGG